MKDKQREVLDIALDKLKKELESNFLSPDRVAVLTNTVEVLMNTSYLEEKVAALERQLAEQPVNIIVDSPSYIAGALNKVLGRENEDDLTEGPSEPLKQTQDDKPESRVFAKGNTQAIPDLFQNLPKENITKGIAPNSQCILSKGSDLDEC